MTAGVGPNKTLSSQIEEEMLTCQELMESTMSSREGTMKFFIRFGELQKAWPVPRRSISKFDDEDDGLRYSVYVDIVKSIVKIISSEKHPFIFGYIIVEYKANKTGDELEEFKLFFQDEIHFVRNKKKTTR